MKRFFLFFCVILFFAFDQAYANHLFGGEISYSFVSESGNTQTYKVTLTFYADCSANIPGTTAYQALTSSTPSVKICRGDDVIQSVFLNYDAGQSNVEITQICDDDVSNSTCTNINNPVPGVKRFVYSKEVIISGKGNDWRFIFTGNMGFTSAGRSTIIQNADIMSGASLMALVATLNNNIGHNNSPEFTSAPNPFFCISKSQAYNLGATDPDNDVLKYSLIPAKRPGTTATSIEDVFYLPPFTPQRPLPTLPSDFSFSHSTGYMYFLPNELKNCVVVNEVEEYRNGVKTGSSMREMTFIILNNCMNDMPEVTLEDVEETQVTIESTNPVFTVCYGFNGVLKFSAHASDINGDNITVTSAGVPANSVLTISNNNTPTPSIHFEWDVSGLVPGDYIFYVNFADDGCPLSVINTRAYTVRVAPYGGIFNTGILGPCVDKGNGKAWVIPFDGDHTNYEYSWTDASGTVLQTSQSNTGDTLRNLALGSYQVLITAPDGCKKELRINVDTYATFPFIELPPDTTLCNDLPFELKADISAHNEYTWNTGAKGCCINISGPGNYIIRASNACGTAEDSIRVDYAICNLCIFIPNAFSPNGDGINDDFTVRLSCQIQKYSIRIFNRWGNLVFNTNKTDQGWNGYYHNLPADVGDYNYIIEAEAVDASRGNLKLKGNITLIR